MRANLLLLACAWPRVLVCRPHLRRYCQRLPLLLASDSSSPAPQPVTDAASKRQSAKAKRRRHTMAAQPTASPRQRNAATPAASPPGARAAHATPPPPPPRTTPMPTRPSTMPPTTPPLPPPSPPRPGQLELKPLQPLRSAPRERAQFTCPSCSELLSPHPTAAQLCCRNGHAIDLAREGHVHLLPPTRSRPSPDADAIVRASRAFFDASGWAAQLEGVAAEVVRAVAECPDVAGEGVQLLAAGCGEGAYLRRVEEAMAAAGIAAGQLVGTDASKLAVRYAARRQPSASFAVASSHRLPFPDGTFDLVLSAFAPAPWDEFCRVLRPGGAVVVARGGREHLLELRRLADPSYAPPPPPKEFSAGLAENYLRLRSQAAAFDGAAAAALLEMCSFVREADPETRERLRSEAAISTTVDVIVSTHRVWLGTGSGRFEV